MTDLQKFQRVCRVFLARLLIVYGPAAPDLLRRIADELEWLEDEQADGGAAGQTVGRDPTMATVGAFNRAEDTRW